MLSKEDIFLLYIQFYKKWFGKVFYGYVNGEFLRNKRNIVCFFKPHEITSLTKAKNSYFCGGSKNLRFALIDAKYELSGSEVKDNYQYINLSQYASDNNVAYDSMYICLVAYRKENCIYDEKPCIDDYYFKYEVCAEDELTCTEKADIHKIGLGHHVKLYKLTCKPDKRHTYKTKIDLPMEAIPHIPGSDRMNGVGVCFDIEDYNWKTATGLGVYGFGNEEIRCIDIDGCRSEEFLFSFLKSIGLPENYPWLVKTGSGEGYHIWVWCTSFPENLLLFGESNAIYRDSHVLFFFSDYGFQNTFKTIEVRWNAFCMLPPSIGPSGNEYSFMFGLPREGFTKVKSDVLFETITSIAKNSTIDYANIVQHDYYGWSDSEMCETLFICLDTETTGLPIDYNKGYKDVDNWPRIVQVSYVIFELIEGNVRERESKDFILCPEEFDIPMEATNIHGISTEIAKEKGYSRKHVLEYIAKQLEHVDYFVGHNVSFDINVLRSEFEREKINVDNQFSHIMPVCTMKSGQKLYPKYSSWPKLENLYQRLTGKELEGAHNSLNDVNATVKCFEKLVQKNMIDVTSKIMARNFKSSPEVWHDANEIE